MWAESVVSLRHSSGGKRRGGRVVGGTAASVNDMRMWKNTAAGWAYDFKAILERTVIWTMRNTPRTDWGTVRRVLNNSLLAYGASVFGIRGCRDPCAGAPVFCTCPDRYKTHLAGIQCFYLFIFPIEDSFNKGTCVA